jgi:hypothetical protein
MNFEHFSFLRYLKIIKKFDFLTRMLRPLCVWWACASGADAHAEHVHQELMHALNIRVRNWCVHWAYTSGTNTCTERSPFKTSCAYASGTDTYPEHTSQELMCMLSIRISSLRVCSACASETECGLAPSKIKILINYFYYQLTYPWRLYGVKIRKIQAIEYLTLRHL